MSTNEKNNLGDPQIDLAAVSKVFIGFFRSLNRHVFLMIQFVIKHIVMLIVLFVIGVGLGLYIDKTEKTYLNEITVRPNFDSTDYTYEKIELLKAKLEEHDTIFLKSIGVKRPKIIKSIEILPIVDIYKFLGDNSQKENEQAFQLLKLMAEEGNMKDVVKDQTTSKNYPYHRISITCKAYTKRNEVVDPILNFLNNSQYFSKVKVIYLSNVAINLNRDVEIMAQIDSIVNQFTSNGRGNIKNDKLVYYNENTQLHDLIETKKNLGYEIARLKLNLADFDQVVKEISVSANKLITKSLNGKFKLILPVFLILIYLFIYFFVGYYKRQAAYFSNEKV